MLFKSNVIINSSLLPNKDVTTLASLTDRSNSASLILVLAADKIAFSMVIKNFFFADFPVLLLNSSSTFWNWIKWWKEIFGLNNDTFKHGFAKTSCRESGYMSLYYSIQKFYTMVHPITSVCGTNVRSTEMKSQTHAIRCIIVLHLRMLW